MPEPEPRVTAYPRPHRLTAPFDHGHQAPTDASTAYRIWCAVAAGLVHLGWWYGGAPLYALLPERRHEKGTP